MVVGTELQIADGLGRRIEQRQELVEPLGGRVVRAGRADDIEPLQAELFLERPERIDLAGNPDHREPLEAGSTGGLEQGQQRRIAHPHAAALRHAGRVGDDHRDRSPAIVWVRRHGEHRVDRLGREQALAEPRCDPGPLRPFARRYERCLEHAPVGAEEPLVATLRVARTAMHLGLEPGIIRLDELTRPAAILGARCARDAAIGAEPRGAAAANGGAQTPGCAA